LQPLYYCARAHGLQTPNEALFSLISQTFGLGQTKWADKFWGTLGIFGRTVSTHFGLESILGQKDENIFVFLVQMKTVEFAFEIN
jgi:hypothetical protein